MLELTPRQIVTELDKYIIGQQDAKRAVAIAIRNRWRRQQVDESMKKEIGPKNMLMIGPTGVGKTEIARRLAALTGAPFIKVEATKYTEVGYYGRDVESMVRELVENAIGIVRKDERTKIAAQAEIAAENRLIDLLAQKFQKDACAAKSATAKTASSEKNGSDAPNADSDSNSTDDSPASPFPFSLEGIQAIKIDPNSPLSGIADFAKQLEKMLNPNSANKTDSARGSDSTNSADSADSVGAANSADSSKNADSVNDAGSSCHVNSSTDTSTDTSSTSFGDGSTRNADCKSEGENAEVSKHGTRPGLAEADSLASDALSLKVDREEIRTRLRSGDYENELVLVVAEQKMPPVIMGGIGMDSMSMENDLQSMFENILPKRNSSRELPIHDARKIFVEQECDRLINKEKVNSQAIELAENLGMIFIDEIDKIVASDRQNGADVSRQGVQRDLLPIVEGTTVQTKYGFVSTEHILFIAAGAFHRAKPSELMPELQGRFPIRVELSDLSQDDFVRILTEPHGSLTKQYIALMKTEGVDLSFEDDAIGMLAQYAYQVNQTSQNIGARRLYTIMERLLEELSFEAPDMRMGHVVVNGSYVSARLNEVAQDEELTKFIL